MNSSITTLKIYDFDETLFRVPSYASKKMIENDSLQFGHPYHFYDHGKSLCLNTYNIQLVEPVFRAWESGNVDSSCYQVMITHRVREVEDEVMRVIEEFGLRFDDTHFLGRASSKANVARQLIATFPNIQEVHVFEDSIHQLAVYQEIEKDMGQLGPEFKFYIVDKSKIFRIKDINISEGQSVRLI